MDYLTLGSLFDGIGGWLLAAKHAGIKPIWASEIDDFPAAVTAKHFPGVVQLGDVRKLDLDWLTPVDIVCAGSPCQDLSVAGSRRGLKGKRSGLFSEAIRIIREMRRRYSLPRYFVWENVPGVFSSNGGLDFRAVLQQISQAEIPMPPDNRWANAGLVEWGSGSLAWRTIDAQHWGVPQRRKRVFLVADLAEKSAGKILFERKGLPGDSEEDGRTGGETAPITGKSIDGTGKELVHNHTYADVASTLRAGAGAPKHMSDIQGRLVFVLQGSMINRKAENGPQGTGIIYQKTIGSLCADDYKGINNQYVKQDKCIIQKYVRRLTPKECERLQGLPDGYTRIVFNGKPATDGHRYKALGNGMAQPCADFVLRRIVELSKIL
ncbi:MAG: DNA cytosine methyltransferase [Selenomonas sp.]|nr:DNA cytosine methyltransferase [Selenomonas sp.]